MKSSAFVSIIVAITIAPWGFSYAQGYGNRDNHAQRGDRQEQRYQSNRRDGWQGRNNHGPSDMRGVGPNHEFHRGQRFPAQYRNQQYVVDDWREHNLRAPPRGYHWVQSGPDYVLVAIATGVILQLLLDH